MPNGPLEPTFLAADSVPKVEMCPGLWRQTLTSAEHVMLCLFTFEKGAELPEHHHAHEQAGFVVKGAIELIIGGKTRILRTGDSYVARSNESHSGRALEETVVLDAFSPPRADYLPGGDEGVIDAGS